MAPRRPWIQRPTMHCNTNTSKSHHRYLLACLATHTKARGPCQRISKKRFKRSQWSSFILVPHTQSLCCGGQNSTGKAVLVFQWLISNCGCMASLCSAQECWSAKFTVSNLSLNKTFSRAGFPRMLYGAPTTGAAELFGHAGQSRSPSQSSKWPKTH